jgi:hypothetical protein
MKRSKEDRLYWSVTPLTLIVSPEKSRVGRTERVTVPALLESLVFRLLAQGGHTVVIPFADVDMTPLFMGRKDRNATPPKKIELIKGEVSACHANSAKLWKKSPKTTQFVTGYALSADGIWRRHSWVMRGETLIETTVRRRKYSGFALPMTLAKKFYNLYCE